MINLWTWAIKLLDIKSIIDIGCSEGHSIEFFLKAGCEAMGVEGYEPAARNGQVAERIAVHDYTKGPYIPHRQFDMAWSCEFVEHVEEKYIEKLSCHIFQGSFGFYDSCSAWAGRPPPCERKGWIAKLTNCGFELDRELTECGRLIAVADHRLVSPNYLSHFMERGLVFLRRYGPQRASRQARPEIRSAP